MPHVADSKDQRDAEAVIRDLAAVRLGIPLAKKKIELSPATRVEIDAASEDESVLVEIFARQGALKGGQVKKVAQDALKLITLKRERPDAKLYLVFASPEAAAYVQNPKGWLTEALRVWGVHVLVVEVPEATKRALLSAQARQVMSSSAAEDDPQND